MITFKNYTIKPNGFGRYDFFKTVTGKKKDTEELYEREENLAYAISFESALYYVLGLLTDEQEKTTVQGYIDAYKENLNEVKKILKAI